MSMENSTDIVDVSKEYPLNYTWNLLFKGKSLNKQQQSEDDWLSSYKHIYKIQSVKTFWQIFNNIHPWSELHVGSIYALFKDGISPSWEDTQNIKGCSYILYLNRNLLNDDSMNEMYLNVLMFLIKNTTSYHEYINGATFDRKYKGDRITFWCTAQSDHMLECIMEEHLGMRKTDYTRSVLPINESYKVVVKLIDHQEELRKIALYENSSEVRSVGVAPRRTSTTTRRKSFKPRDSRNSRDSRPRDQKQNNKSRHQ